MLEKLLIIGIIGLFVLTPLGEGTLDDGDNEWFYDEETGRWNIEFTEPLHESFMVKYGFVQSFKVGVLFTHDYVFPDHATGFLEASYDHGETWKLLSEFKDRLCDGTNIYTTITSNSLWLRYTIDSSQGWGRWSIWDIDIIGDTKIKPVETSISAGGYQVDTYGYWIDWPLNIEIYAQYDKNKRMIYCIDNECGKVYFTYARKLNFTIAENGIHKLMYWSVDCRGNEESPKLMPKFGIDIADSPELSVDFLKPGIYVLGKKIISCNKTIFIGSGFTIRANASDKLSGLYRVLFLLDNELLGEDTEPPYQFYYYKKHIGAVEIRVIAEDYIGNKAEENLLINYYNFF